MKKRNSVKRQIPSIDDKELYEIYMRNHDECKKKIHKQIDACLDEAFPNTVENRHTKEGDETYARRNAERHSAQPECPDATYCSKRNGGEHEERLAQILDRGIEQQQNDDERYRNHDEQALGGTLKILKLATIIIIVAFRHHRLRSRK